MSAALLYFATASTLCAWGCAGGASAIPDAGSNAAGHPGAGGATASSGGSVGAGGSPSGGGGASPVAGTSGEGGSPSADASADTAAPREDAKPHEDAKAADAKPADAAPEAPAPSDADGPHAAGCAGTTFALCEDFESGALDTKLWKATQNKGTATLDSTRAARGSKTSVHVHVDPGSDTMVGLVEGKTFPALAKKLYARAFIYIPGATSTSLFTGDRHSRLIYAQGATPYGEYALGIWNGGIIQNHYSKTDDSVDTKMLPPFDQWFCLEYELDAAAGNVRAYLNDIEITALRHDGWPATNIASLMFGVDRYGTFAVAEDLWFDDLVVDGARIGCAR